MRIGCIVNLKQDIEESFSEALALGFTSGQIAVWDMSLYNQDNARRVRDFCAAHSFSITAVWCGWSGPVIWKYPDMYATLGLVPTYLRWQRTQDILLGARFAHEIGVHDIVTHIGYFPDNPYDKDHIEITHCLRIICNELKQKQQRFLFETGEELPVTLLALIDEVGTGNLGVNFDPANLMSSGRANSIDALRMFRNCLFGVHAKDATYPKAGQTKGEEKPLGEGETQFPTIVKMLKEFGYEGDITIECEMDDPKQRRTNIMNAHRLIQQWWND